MCPSVLKRYPNRVLVDMVQSQKRRLQKLVFGFLVSKGLHVRLQSIIPLPDDRFDILWLISLRGRVCPHDDDQKIHETWDSSRDARGRGLGHQGV